MVCHPGLNFAIDEGYLRIAWRHPGNPANIGLGMEMSASLQKPKQALYAERFLELHVLDICAGK
jgi:hypothetical protein